MFYFKEVFLRLTYLLLSFILIYTLIFLCEDKIICIFIGLIQQSQLSNYSEYYFYFNNLENFAIFKLGFSFNITIITFLPFITKHVYSFYECCISKKKNKKIAENLEDMLFFYYKANFVFIYVIVPAVWGILENSAEHLIELSLINIELNYGLEFFIRFLIWNLLILNLNLCIHYMMIWIYYILYDKVEIYNFIYCKNIFIFFILFYICITCDFWISAIYIANLLLAQLFDFVFHIKIVYEKLKNI